eukprot:8958143-Pyramimonas_sp.AAC.1
MPRPPHCPTRLGAIAAPSPQAVAPPGTRSPSSPRPGAAPPAGVNATGCTREWSICTPCSAPIRSIQISRMPY